MIAVWLGERAKDQKIMSTTNSIGERVRARRKAMDLTQRELGDRASVGQSTICDLEKGTLKNPGILTLRSIEEALDLPAGTLARATPDESLHKHSLAEFLGSDLGRDVTPDEADMLANMHLPPGRRPDKVHWAMLLQIVRGIPVTEQPANIDKHSA